MPTAHITPADARELVLTGDPRIFREPTQGVQTSSPCDFAASVCHRLGIEHDPRFVRQLAKLFVGDLNGDDPQLVAVSGAYQLPEQMTDKQRVAHNKAVARRRMDLEDRGLRRRPSKRRLNP